MSHAFQLKQTQPCSSRLTRPFHTLGLDSCRLIFLGFSSALTSLSLPGKIPHDFQCSDLCHFSHKVMTNFHPLPGRISSSLLYIPSQSIHSAHLLNNSSGRPPFLTLSERIEVSPLVLLVTVYTCFILRPYSVPCVGGVGGS